MIDRRISDAVTAYLTSGVRAHGEALVRAISSDVCEDTGMAHNITSQTLRKRLDYSFHFLMEFLQQVVLIQSKICLKAYLP